LPHHHTFEISNIEGWNSSSGDTSRDEGIATSIVGGLAKTSRYAWIRLSLDK